MSEQLVDPGRVVVGLHDQPLDADQAGGVLPGAGLAENVEAADVAAHQPPLAEGLGDAVDRRHVALRGRHVLADQVDVAFLFDQRLDDPGRVRIGTPGPCSACPWA